MQPLFLSLTQLAEVAQIAAGLGVILVVIQVWQGVNNSRVGVVTGLTTLISDVDRVFLDRPELWKYFNGSEPTPPKDNKEGERVRVMALTMANVLDHIVEHRGKLKRETRASWLRYVDEVYAKSPAFREALTEHHSWWPGLQRQVRGLNR